MENNIAVEAVGKSVSDAIFAYIKRDITMSEVVSVSVDAWFETGDWRYVKFACLYPPMDLSLKSDRRAR